MLTITTQDGTEHEIEIDESSTLHVRGVARGIAYPGDELGGKIRGHSQHKFEFSNVVAIGFEALEVPRAEKAEEEPDVTDAAEAKAKELGVDLATVEGTGEDGRVLVGDVEAAAKE